MSDTDLSRQKTLAFALVAGLVLGGCANTGGPGEDPMPQAGGDEQASISQLDQNADDRVSESEFESYAEENDVFDEWDENSDGMLEQDEFTDIGLDRTVANYSAWDQDGDGMVGSDEFYESVFDAYDEDNDGYWNTTEWVDAGASGLFDV